MVDLTTVVSYLELRTGWVKIFYLLSRLNLPYTNRVDLTGGLSYVHRP